MIRALTLALASFVGAPEAIRIEGPDQLEVRELAFFDLTGLPTEFRVHFRWKVFGPSGAIARDMSDRQGNPVMVFQAKHKGDYAIIGDVNMPPDRFELISHTFTVGPRPDPNPDPDPTPDPDPDPDPDPPDSDVEAAVRKLKTLVKGTSAQISKESAALAAAYRGLAARIAEKKFVVREKVPAELRQLQAKALGNRLSAWKPFFQGYANLLDKLEDDGKMQTVFAIGTILEETVDGLK
jgi:hypothetical protein